MVATMNTSLKERMMKMKEKKKKGDIGFLQIKSGTTGGNNLGSDTTEVVDGVKDKINGINK